MNVPTLIKAPLLVLAALALLAGGSRRAGRTAAAAQTVTFGITTSAGTNDDSDFGFINGSPATLSTPGALASLSVYVGATPPGAHIRVALYTNNGSGNPGALIAQTGEGTAQPGWNVLLAPPGTNLAPGTYWIVAQTDNRNTVYRVAGALTASDFVGWAPQTYGPFPTTISGWTKFNQQAFDMYGTVNVTPDTMPPVISNVQATSITSSGATISWTTDKPATSQVQYGTTTSYGTSVPATPDASLVTSHSEALSGLTPSTTYHYRVLSQDASGNLATSTDFTFATAASPCTPPITNAIVCENSKPGNPPSEWDVSGAGDPSIQGFANDISVNKGGTVHFKINTTATSYRIDIYRMGYYGAMGARKVGATLPSAPLPQNQPSCLSDSTTGLVDCGNWAESASWPVPADAVSGIYFAKLVRTDGVAGASHIFFIVRDDASHSDLLFQTSDTTWQAYNSYGGNSLYVGSPAGRAFKVSYNRPFNTRTGDGVGGPQDFVFNAEYPMIRWLEANGYDVTYFTDMDSDRRGTLIQQHKVFMSVGHDEYWSGGQRANVEAARAAGVNIAFFSGNEISWKTRWENSIDGTNTPYRTLVSYKETTAGTAIDPLDPPTTTAAWRDLRFGPPADGGRPENTLSGTISTVECCTYAITVPAEDASLRFWRNTSIAALTPGQSAVLSDGTLGYEWDEDLDNGSRPPGVVDMSSTTVSVPSYTLMPGLSTGPGVATHKLTLYRAPSGALVFGAGTVQWSWGLDGTHDRGSSIPDPRMQQATVNLLADMRAPPGSLQPGLVAATASTDTTPPTSKITSPTSGATLQPGIPVTITGTAADAGGGGVAGVEVSVDGGATWHPASGRANWSYTWTPAASGSVTIRSRAVDDSANLETPSAGVTVTVGSSSSSVTFGLTASTGTNDNSDFGFVNGSPGTLSVAGTLTSLSVYVGATPGTGHIRLALYTNNASGNPGTLIAQTGEAVAVAGWNTLPVPSGISLTPGIYWILAQTDNNSTVFRITSGLSSSNFVGWAPQAYGPFPSAISGFTRQASQAFDMFGTVSTAPPATSTPTATPTSTPTPGGPTPTNTATATATNTPNPGVASNPILAVVNSASPNPLGPYLIEILKAEGFNEVQQADLSTVNPSFLQSFDVVLLAETPLTATQASMFNSYVTGGGNLIAMRPDPQLNATLGITSTGTITSEGYIKIDTSKAPGAGIYSNTMQFHGDADNYTLNGATAAATLYASATTATAFPALTLVNTGSGRAAAFAFDLAKSIAYTRQGNPAFAGQERDGQAGIRASDMFVGYLDLAKLGVPQADEHQRLLTNVIFYLNQNHKPLPRLWYLPGQNKAIYLPTDDQDAGAATTIDQMLTDAESFGGHMTVYVANSCYQCVTNTDPVTPAVVNSWRSRGHTVGPHIDDAANATNPTVANMTAAQTTGISNFLSAFGPPISQTVRNHWIVWVGWGQQGALETSQGFYLDHNYYTWGNWLGANPVGYMTGSALPMLIFDDSFKPTQTYGMLTELSDEVHSSNIGPDAGQLFDAALGTQGFYGAIVANVHAYRLDDPSLLHDTLVAASSRGVPIWNSDRFLQFAQMRHNSAFSNVAWNGSTLTFAYNAVGSGDSISVMLPAVFQSSQLSAVQVNGSSVPFNIQTIKGIDYAFVTVNTGTSNFSMTYVKNTTPPVISNVQVSNITNNSATVTWTTNAKSDSTVNYGVSPATNLAASDTTLVTQHSIALTGLGANTSYSYFVTSKDAFGNAASSTVATFTTAQAAVTQTTYADFAAGTPTNVNVTEDSGGELRLAAQLYDAFNGTSLSPSWTSTPWSAGGTATVGGGTLTVNGTDVSSNMTFSGSRVLEGRVNFGATPFEHFGLATDLNGNANSAWALFSTMGTSNTLFARTLLNGVEQTVNLGGGIGSFHTYQISWQPTGLQYYIDGTLVATASAALAAPMSVHMSEFNSGGPALVTDWVRVDQYPVSPGTFVSSAIDTSLASAAFNSLLWTGSFPTGTSVSFQTRTAPDGTTWSAWSPAITTSGSQISSPAGRFIQYQVTLTSNSTTTTPSVDSVTITYGPTTADTTPPVISNLAATPGATTATITWTTNKPSTSVVNYGTTTAYGQTQSDPTLTTAHSVTLPGLSQLTAYHFQAQSTDAANNTATSADQTFTTAGQIVQTTTADFLAGTRSGTGVTEDSGGEVRLAPAFNDLFNGTALGSAWTASPWATGGSATEGGGIVTVNGADLASTATFGPANSIEAKVTFGAAPFSHFGLATDLSSGSASNWALFSTKSTSDTLFARTMRNGVETSVSLGTGLIGAPHVYRIVWDATGVRFFVDGPQVASNTTSITAPMAAHLSEFGVGGPSISADWLRIATYSTAGGNFVSSAIDAGATHAFTTLQWTATTPANTGVTFETRTSNDSSAWSAWQTVASNGGPIASPAGRFIQYRATFSTSNPQTTAVVLDVTVNFSAASTP